MFYGLETIGTTKELETELNVVEVRMLRWSFGLTRIVIIPNAKLEAQRML